MSTGCYDYGVCVTCSILFLRFDPPVKHSTGSLKLFKISERWKRNISGLVEAFGKLEKSKLHLGVDRSQNGMAVMMDGMVLKDGVLLRKFSS